MRRGKQWYNTDEDTFMEVLLNYLKTLFFGPVGVIFLTAVVVGFLFMVWKTLPVYLENLYIWIGLVEIVAVTFVALIIIESIIFLVLRTIFRAPKH